MRILIFISVLFGVSFGHAARIVKSDFPLCAISITGDFELADADKFKDLIKPDAMGKDIFGEQWILGTNLRRAVCLNSQGGNFDEGLRIAKILLEQSIGTVIRPDHQCYSTCAFVFMFGTVRSVDNLRDPFRLLAVQGALGFHAPFVDGGDQGSQDKFFREGVRSILRFFDALYTRSARTWVARESLDQFFPIELLIKVLGTEKKDLYRIQTIDDAGRWGISLWTAPIRTLEGSAEQRRQAMLQACVSERNWRHYHTNSKPLKSDKEVAPLKPKRVKRFEKATRTLFEGLGQPDGPLDCELDEIKLDDGSKKLHVRLSGQAFDEEVFNRKPFDLPAYFDETWKTLDPNAEICTDSCLTIREIK